MFCGALLHGLWCGSMLVSVAFAYVAGSAGKEISGEEGINRLSPSSTMLSFVAEDCVNVVVRVIQNDDIIQNGYGCVGADAQSLLVSSTSVVWVEEV